MTKVAALVPLKLQSRRLPNKNFLRLGDNPLAYHIFKTLVDSDGIEEVYSYASQPQVMKLLPQGVRFLARPPYLDGDNVKANELFRYAVERIDAEVIVLCHATSPFIRSDTIKEALSKVTSGEYRSAAAVQRMQTYCWYDEKPLNYDPEAIAQTQSISPVYAETSGAYIFRKSDYLEHNTRINSPVYLAEVDPREAVDIDELSDFNLAVKLLDYTAESTSSTRDHFFVDLMNAQARNRNVELVAFDLDGVLIDSVPAMEMSWNATMKDVGLSVPFASYAHYIGYPFQVILQSLQIDGKYHDDITRLYNAYSLQNQSHIRIYDGVREGLKELASFGMKLAVATSKNRERTTAILDQLLPDISFDLITTPDDVKAGRGKPYPDQLLKCALSASADPSRSVYIGDMEVDKQAAVRAGFHFVHAGWGYGDIENTEDVWFANMTDFTRYIIG